jgi:hypothetical protein
LPAPRIPHAWEEEKKDMTRRCDLRDKENPEIVYFIDHCTLLLEISPLKIYPLHNFKNRKTYSVP